MVLAAAILLTLACIPTVCAAAPPASGRLRVGIIGFTGPFGSQYVQYASNCLSDVLVDMRRFEVVERANIDRILAEQRFQVSGAVNRDTAVRLGEILGIDYAFIGSLDRCEGKSEYWTDKDGRRHYYYSGSAEVSIRIIDASTGTIVSSLRLRGWGRDDSSPSAACLDAVKSCFGSTLRDELVAKFPVIGEVLEARSNHEVYIRTEEASVMTPGSSFRILRPNVTQVGGSGSRHQFVSTDQVAVVRIVSVYGTIARAKIVESSGEVVAGDYAVQVQGYRTPGERAATALAVVVLVALVALAAALQP
jgi:hypothetical protein